MTRNISHHPFKGLAALPDIFSVIFKFLPTDVLALKTTALVLTYLNSRNGELKFSSPLLNRVINENIPAEHLGTIARSVRSYFPTIVSQEPRLPLGMILITSKKLQRPDVLRGLQKKQLPSLLIKALAQGASTLASNVIDDDRCLKSLLDMNPTQATAFITRINQKLTSLLDKGLKSRALQLVEEFIPISIAIPSMQIWVIPDQHILDLMQHIKSVKNSTMLGGFIITLTVMAERTKNLQFLETTLNNTELMSICSNTQLLQVIFVCIKKTMTDSLRILLNHRSFNLCDSNLIVNYAIQKQKFLAISLVVDSPYHLQALYKNRLIQLLTPSISSELQPNHLTLIKKALQTKEELNRQSPKCLKHRKPHSFEI